MVVKLLGLGDNTVDTYVDRGVQYPGGNAVNVAILTKRLGASADYLGCLGNDEAGDLLFEALSAEGIGLSHIRRVAGANARARIGHRGPDRYFIGSIPGVRGDYGPITDDLDYISGFDLVHTSIYSELDAELPRIAALPPMLSYDFSERWTAKRFDEVLPWIDVAFFSAPKLDEAACIALMRDCASKGPRYVVATRGAEGALGLAGGELLKQPALPANVVDTLGAGDGFISAFLMSICRELPLDAALRAGAGFAADVCGYHGAFGHGASWAEPGA
ncbi:fructoselysine kinase [Acetobacteraceae bacterium H6797]|nr:fructoselysine kinase [Acetobacteraceae bacterium H6797]